MRTALRTLLMLSAALCLLLPGAAAQADDSQPKDWWYKNIVDADFVQQYVKVPRPEGVLIIDSRPYETKVVNGYIPTAVSMPFSKFEDKKDQLPEDKDTLLIFYCGGFKCKLSHKAAKMAEGWGYTNIKVFAAGFSAYKKTAPYYSVGVENVKAKLTKNEDYLLIDARPANKYIEGQIPSSVNIPFSKFEKKKGLLPADKSTRLIYYCGGYKCKLSHKSAVAAKKLGYTNVVVADAGYPAWKELYGASGAVALGGEVEGSVDMEYFKKAMANDFKDIYVYDVRDQDEWDAGHLENTIHMPVDQLEKSMASLKTDKPIVFICTTGARSGESFYMVQDMRPEIKDVYYLEAEVEYNKDGTIDITPPKD